MPVSSFLSRLALATLISLLLAGAVAPDSPIWKTQPTVAEVRGYESDLGSQRVPVPSPTSEAAVDPDELRRHCPASRANTLSRRLHFHRPSSTLPPARVRYFAGADSTVHCISYTWDESHTLSGKQMVKRLSRGGVDPDTVVVRYDMAFDEIVRVVRSEWGPPDMLDERPIADTSGANKQYRRHARWTTPEVRVDVTLNVSLLGGQIQVDQAFR